MGTQLLAGSRGIYNDREFVVVEDTCLEKNTVPVVFDTDATQNVQEIPHAGVRFTHRLTEDY